MTEFVIPQECQDFYAGLNIPVQAQIDARELQVEIAHMKRAIVACWQDPEVRQQMADKPRMAAWTVKEVAKGIKSDQYKDRPSTVDDYKDLVTSMAALRDKSKADKQELTALVHKVGQVEARNKKLEEDAEKAKLLTESVLKKHMDELSAQLPRGDDLNKLAAEKAILSNALLSEKRKKRRIGVLGILLAMAAIAYVAADLMGVF